MIGLETERLIFRQWKESDFEQVARFYSDTENARFVGGVQTHEQSYRLIASYIGHYELHGYSNLAVEERESKMLIGTIGLWNSIPWPEPEIGYWLIPEFRGKRYAVEAGRAVQKYARDVANVDSLVSYIDPENVVSKKVALRLGAKYDKTIQLLDFGPHEVYRYW